MENVSDNDITNGDEDNSNHESFCNDDNQSLNNMDDSLSENSNVSDSKIMEPTESVIKDLKVTDEIFDKNCEQLPNGYKCNVCSKVILNIQAMKSHLKSHKFIFYDVKPIETVADILTALVRSQDIPNDKWNLIYTDDSYCFLCIKNYDYAKIKADDRYAHALKVHAGQHICRVCHLRFNYRKV